MNLPGTGRLSTLAKIERFLGKYDYNFKDNNKLNENQLKFSQQKVLNILYRWVTLQPENFQIDPKLHCQLQNFLTEEVRNVGFQEDIDRILSNCKMLTDSPIQNDFDHSVSSGNSDKAFQKSPKSTSLMRDSSPLLEFEAKNIAKYLTLMDFNALKSITFFDFITVWWRKRQAFESQGSPNAALKDQQFGLIETSFLKDLTIIMQGAPTFLPNNNFRGKKSRNISVTTTPTIEYSQESRELQGITSSSSISSTFSEEQYTKSELINFEKLRSLIKNVYNIKRYTSKSYPFENQLSRLPTINNTTISLTNTPSLSTSSITKTNTTSTPMNILSNNIASHAKSSLDYIGEIIEKRLYETAGAIFGGNVALMAMSDGGELEADLMALSLEAEPVVTSPQ
ncbi:ras guanine nucleotide exchange factor domain-containing protein [Gigaspora rosea]|uniref:Ras guanine nucleotide exchange factor domain-containing protein n=1 Tax=Gigaspora rosea TaxID=44941 RepID=A0A397U194_9GLOM|nr:ras guanine nucleotide exchange factor domain-containing protein [Gigaspora rosea]